VPNVVSICVEETSVEKEATAARLYLRSIPRSPRRDAAAVLYISLLSSPLSWLSRNSGSAVIPVGCGIHRSSNDPRRHVH
jgi:hypothetical protein